MSLRSLRALLRRVRGRMGPAGKGGVSDAALLGRFVGGHDEAAFELLVWRHGPMVLGACRRVLRHEQDAEDAFQATFLTLARKAASVGRRESLGGWLYTVARRVALRARERRDARGHSEELAAAGRAAGPGAGPAEGLAAQELRPVLDEEIARLPRKFRDPFVLCYLEGKTNAEAAELLGCPKGTVLSRLARARARLRRRLEGRDITPAALPLAAPPADVSPALVRGAARLAGFVAAGGALAGAAPAAVLTLADAALAPGALAGAVKVGGLLVVLAAAGAGVAALVYAPAHANAPAGAPCCHKGPRAGAAPAGKPAPP